MLGTVFRDRGLHYVLFCYGYPRFMLSALIFAIYVISFRIILYDTVAKSVSLLCYTVL